MGYDMTIKGSIAPNDPVEIDKARAELNAEGDASRARKDAMRTDGTFTWDLANESDTKYWELHGKHSALAYPGEFRLNIWGMSRFADAMIELGMAHNSSSTVTSEEWGELPDQDEVGDAYYEALDKLTGQHGNPAGNPNIPLHKFSSNDGWLVTPDEISAALEAWDNRTENLTEHTVKTMAEKHWGEWIAYLRLAATHEGFRVF